MYIKPTKEQIKNGMEWGWSKEQCERGYDIFDYDGTGMLNIEAIYDVYCSTNDDEGYNDEECAREAVRSGFCKIIPINKLPKNFPYKYYIWIDTQENRKAIEKYCNRGI